MILVTGHNNRVCKLNVEKKKFLAQVEIDDIDVRAVVFGYDKVAILSRMSVLITTPDL